MMSKLALAMALLDQEKCAEKVGVLKALHQTVRKAGRELSDAGHPIAGTAVGLLPAAGVAYGVHKGLQTGPGQSLVNKYREWKYNRALQQQAQQGYGY